MLVTTSKWVTSAMLVIVGVVHLLPVTGIAGSQRLAALYGIDVADVNVEILMRHRAVLFGLLGTYLVLAAWRPSLQPLALVAGWVSVASFLWLTHAAGDYNGHLARVVAADILAAICLTAGSVSYLIWRHNG